MTARDAASPRAATRRRALARLALVAAASVAGCGGGGPVTASSGSSDSPTLAGRWRLISTPLGGYANASFDFTPDGNLAGTEANGTFSGTWSPLFPGANQFRVRLSYVDARVPNAPVTGDYTVNVTSDSPPHAVFLGGAIELIAIGPP